MPACMECGRPTSGVRPGTGPMCDACALATAGPVKTCWNCNAALTEDGHCSKSCEYGQDENPDKEGAE